jgi:tetratricopeptide (TPR) repeat protein
MANRWTLAAAVIVVVGSVVAARADDNTQQRPQKTAKDTAVQSTSWGQVTGQVYDAQTGAPLQGASVAVQDEGVFADSGKTVGHTDAAGRYKCAAIIGRVSENLDVGRLLSTGLVGLLGGGATNKTKRIDITRLCLRVSKDGYKQYEGIVYCRSSEPEAFTVVMEPVLLTRADGPEVSTTAPGWGIVRVEEVKIDPPVLRPGGRATVTVSVACPAAADIRSMRTTAVWQLSDRPVVRQLKLKAEPAQGIVTFVGELNAPQTKDTLVGEVVVLLTACPYDVAPEGRRGTALAQVVANNDDETVASERAAAYALHLQGDNVAAVQKLKTVVDKGGTLWDYTLLAKMSETLHDKDTAIQAYKRAVELAPAKPDTQRLVCAASHAAALAANGEGDKAITEYSSVVEAVPDKDRPKRLPPALLAALGTSYVQCGRLSEADAINQSLSKYARAGLDPSVIDFRTSLRLAQAQAELKADPKSASARAGYARALMDLGRWEEAVDELRSAAIDNPGEEVLRRDLAYAVLHVRGKDTATEVPIDQAIAAAEAQTQVTIKGKVAKTKDFFAWHSLAMLLYAKQAQQLSSGQREAAASTGNHLRDVLLDALKCGRAGADVSAGRYSYMFGYMSPRVVAISGFAYPEANSDWVILDSLTTLAKRPDDYLAHLGLGTALLDLGQAGLAAEPIQRALQLRPDSVEARYLGALVALQQGDRAAARKALRDVLTANPRHPRANLVLAKLYAEDGDDSASATCLAAHAQFYGSASSVSR